MRLRTLDWCTTVPRELQLDRPETKALLKAPGLALRERVGVPQTAPVAVDARSNPRTVDLRFVRDEIVSATEANACAWRKKAAPRIPDQSFSKCVVSFLHSFLVCSTCCMTYGVTWHGRHD